MPTLAVPATVPLSAATASGSVADTTRVRLLSIAHAMHAAATRSAEESSARVPLSFHASVAAPAVIATHSDRDSGRHMLPKDQRGEHGFEVQQGARTA